MKKYHSAVILDLDANQPELSLHNLMDDFFCNAINSLDRSITVTENEKFFNCSHAQKPRSYKYRTISGLH